MAISVIIPCFNAAAFLPSAGCVVRQGVSGAEIIVVDDASTNHTVAVARQLAQEIENLRVIRRALNEGPGHCRNVGLREARGPARTHWSLRTFAAGRRWRRCRTA